MEASQYQKEMQKFVSGISCFPEQSQLIQSALGITGEAGEYADLIKKTVFHGKAFDKKRAVKELGDVCWYIALACNCLDVSLEDVFQINIEKLNARYSSGHFTVQEANNRAENDI